MKRSGSGTRLAPNNEKEDDFQRTPVGRTKSSTQSRITRSGSGAKIDEALKRSGSGTRLFRTIGGKSGSSRQLNANWPSSSSKGGVEGKDHKEERKSPSRNLGPKRTGSSRNLSPKRTGSSRNLLGSKSGSSRNLSPKRTGSSRNLLLGSKNGSSTRNLSPKRTGTSRNLGSKSGSSRNIVGDGDMKNHMDNIEAFLQVVSNTSKEERDKLVTSALQRGASKK